MVAAYCCKKKKMQVYHLKTRKRIWTHRKTVYSDCIIYIICQKFNRCVLSAKICLIFSSKSCQQQLNIFHNHVRLPCILQLYGFDFSGSDRETLNCSRCALSGWLEEFRPVSAPCAPAMQQCYELKDERSGGV